jgi:Holliday junction resolvase RusA-like endonuclease
MIILIPSTIGIATLIEQPSIMYAMYDVLDKNILSIGLISIAVILSFTISIIDTVNSIKRKRRIKKTAKKSKTHDLYKTNEIEESLKRHNDELKKELEELKSKFSKNYIYYTKEIEKLTDQNKKLKKDYEEMKIRAQRLLKERSQAQIIINNPYQMITDENWQQINQHGFSVNKMYTVASNKLVKSPAYDAWIGKTLRMMKEQKLRSLSSMNVNPNKPMMLEVEFKLTKGSDTDNPLKSFLDLLVRHYKLSDDNNFYKIIVSRDPVFAKNESEGEIKFRITNIEINLPEVKKEIIKESEKSSRDEARRFMESYLKGEFEYMCKRNSFKKEQYRKRMEEHIRNYPDIYRELKLRYQKRY